MVIEARLRTAIAALNTRSDTARLDVELLLANVLNVTRSWLYAHGKSALTDQQLIDFKHKFDRRLRGEPMSYILGEQAFWSLSFKVNRHVLIPRPETELLVEKLLSQFSADAPVSLVDLGCGSGAIGLSIAYERPCWAVTLVDNSPNALAVARENGRRLQLRQVAYMASDWCQQLPDRAFNVMVANPPYIAEADPHLLQGDVRFEPREALVAKAQGLEALRQIIQQSRRCLMPGGTLWLEHGYNQHASVATMLRQKGFQAIDCYQDLSRIDRVTTASLPIP